MGYRLDTPRKSTTLLAGLLTFMLTSAWATPPSHAPGAWEIR